MSNPDMELTPMDVITDQPEPRDSRYDMIDLSTLIRAMSILDQKLDWCMTTLQWMAQVFQGLQAMTSIMPGKAGKMARDMMAQMQQPTVESENSDDGS